MRDGLCGIRGGRIAVSTHAATQPRDVLGGSIDWFGGSFSVEQVVQYNPKESIMVVSAWMIYLISMADRVDTLLSLTAGFGLMAAFFLFIAFCMSKSDEDEDNVKLCKTGLKVILPIAILSWMYSNP